jgi:two-component system OmpR family response regulator
VTSQGVPHHIAVLDDEVDITELLANCLDGQGFRVSQVHQGRALDALMATDTPSLVLLDLDLGLPGDAGFAIARRLREHHQCELIIITGRGDAVDKVVGLEIGADDYVAKPFDLRELLARIKSVLRRVAAPPAAPPAASAPERLRFLDWELDLAARRLVNRGGVEVALTSGEFDLLSVFVRHPGRVLSRDFLLESTCGREAVPVDRTIDVQGGRLRKKLEADSDNPQLIKSARSAGYMFAVPMVSA